MHIIYFKDDDSEFEVNFNNSNNKRAQNHDLISQNLPKSLCSFSSYFRWVKLMHAWKIYQNKNESINVFSKHLHPWFKEDLAIFNFKLYWLFIKKVKFVGFYNFKADFEGLRALLCQNWFKNRIHDTRIGVEALFLWKKRLNSKSVLVIKSDEVIFAIFLKFRSWFWDTWYRKSQN